MTLTDTAKDFKLDGSTLKASCLNGEKNYVDATLDLDKHIGNNDGDFTTEKDGFYSYAKNVSLDAKEVILFASLKTDDNLYIDRTFEIALYVSNDNGTLRFTVPDTNILNSVVNSSYSISGGLLKAQALGTDGHLHWSTINLDNYFKNSNGDFRRGKDFSVTAKNIRVKAYKVANFPTVVLNADLYKRDGKTTENAIETLDLYLVNKRGYLAMKG